MKRDILERRIRLIIMIVSIIILWNGILYIGGMFSTSIDNEYRNNYETILEKEMIKINKTIDENKENIEAFKEGVNYEK